MTRMVFSKHLFVLFFVAFGASAPQKGRIIATVNGDPIYATELATWSSKKGRFTSGDDLERLVLYRLAIQEAKKKGFSKHPEVKKELDRTLYRAFLKEALKQTNRSLLPKKADVEGAYQKSPLIRVEAIVLQAHTKKEKRQAKTALQAISEGLKKNASFSALAIKYSQAHSSRYAGDLDLIGKHSFPAPLYGSLIELKDGQISEPLLWQEVYYLLRRKQTLPFAKITGTYRQFLEAEIRSENEKSFLSQQLAKLRAKSDIQYQLSPMTP